MSGSGECPPSPSLSARPCSGHRRGSLRTRSHPALQHFKQAGRHTRPRYRVRTTLAASRPPGTAGATEPARGCTRARPPPWSRRSSGSRGPARRPGARPGRAGSRAQHHGQRQGASASPPSRAWTGAARPSAGTAPFRMSSSLSGS